MLPDPRSLRFLSHRRRLRTEPLVCIECQRPWLDPSERWRVYNTDDDPPEGVPYCNHCAAREFDP
jgi:hypothetical protein